jgi:DNA-binding response OmpR family regulator
MKNISILIVEDEININEIVKNYLDKEGYTTHQSFDGKSALENFDKHNPDIILLDIMLPDILGTEICKEIRKKSNAYIVMLTAKSDEASIIEGLGIGADEYITKPFSAKELVARINSISRRIEKNPEQPNHIYTFNNKDLVIDTNTYEVKKRGQLLSLTATEYKILLSMVKYPNKVFTREELIILVLGYDYDGMDRAIDTHIKNIRQKIEDDHKNPAYLTTVYGIGYKFCGGNTK